MSLYNDRAESIRQRFENKRKDAESAAILRKHELYAVIPELQALDGELSGTGTKILAAAAGGGDVAAKIEELKQKNGEVRKKRAELLLKNGYPADYTDIHYKCEKCSDSGFVGVKMCECMKRAMAAAALSSSGLGRLAETESFANFRLDYYKPGREREAASHNLAALKGFAEGFSRETKDSWLLVGATGLGKTHLSTAAAVTVIGKGYDVVYCTMLSMIEDFERVQFHNESPEITRKYGECDLLIADDLGSEMINKFTVSCLYNVINTRINSKRPTIFSTNLTQSELRDSYDDRITSRLFGNFKPLMFVGTDIRRQKLSEK